MKRNSVKSVSSKDWKSLLLLDTKEEKRDKIEILSKQGPIILFSWIKWIRLEAMSRLKMAPFYRTKIIVLDNLNFLAIRLREKGMEGKGCKERRQIWELCLEKNFGEEGIIILNSFYKASITLVPKPEKDTIRKENYRPIPLMNAKFLNSQPNSTAY